MNALFAVGDVNTDAVFGVEVLREMLGAINGAMLAASAAEREHEVGEATLEVTFDMMVGQTVNAIEEGEDLTIVLEETDDRLIQASELFVSLITTRVVRGTTVEDIATTVAALILRDAAFVGEGEDADG